MAGVGALAAVSTATAQTPALGPEPSLGLRGVDAPSGPARRTARAARPPRAAPTAARVAAQTRRAVRPDGALLRVQPPVAVLPDPAQAGSEPAGARRRRPVEDPYAPLGLRMGGVTLLPAIEQTAGHDSNPNRDSGRREGSRLLRTDAELRVESDWSRHALAGALRGGYSAYPDVEGANRPDGEGQLALRLDALRDTRIDLDTRFRVDTQRPGSPELGVAVSERPIVASYGAGAGVTQRFNRLSLGLRGTIDRTAYEDADLGNGVILDQSDRDVTQYGLRLRGGYEIHPGLTPFVEALVDTRVHDQAVDRAGYKRDSVGLGARVGSTFEVTRTLTGEVAAGYQARDYEDTRLKELRGLIADASLVWSATPLTTVRLRGAAALEETSIVGSSGATGQRVALEVQHDLRRNVTLTAIGRAERVDYRGVNLTEDVLAATLRLDYKLTRSVAVRGSFTHERLTSSTPGSDYTANVFLVGLRLQP